MNYDGFDELWLPFEGYEISNFGRKKNRYGKVSLGTLHGRAAPHGKQGKRVYRTVNVRNEHNYKMHRLVLTLFVGDPPEGHMALHRDDDGLHNCVWNLYWGTEEDNERDKALNKDRVFEPCVCGYTR